MTALHFPPKSTNPTRPHWTEHSEYISIMETTVDGWLAASVYILYRQSNHTNKVDFKNKVERFVLENLRDLWKALTNLSRGLRSVVWPYLGLMRPSFHYISIHLCDWSGWPSFGWSPTIQMLVGVHQSRKWMLTWWKFEDHNTIPIGKWDNRSEVTWDVAIKQ